MASGRSVSELVNGNSIDKFMAASELLIEYANNVLGNLSDPFYRRIRIDNPIVERKLKPANGAFECLYEMGFVKDGEDLVLPANVPLHKLRKIRDDLIRERKVIHKQRMKSASGDEPIIPLQQRSEYPANIHVLEYAFYQKLLIQMTHVLRYENPRLQKKVRELIPVLELQKEAKKRAETANQSTDAGKKIDMQDSLLLALLNWFKTSFFKWVDTPPCHYCHGKTAAEGLLDPTKEELRWEANNVESYRCSSCQKLTRFPRYNNPEKLLETREGRCGEWANCFTLFARSMGFEARHVLDWTDHVWTEVFSMSQQRWLHCDPCENVCDKPLLYEAGWGKKLTYVIAFSKEDVQDVSWRYSAKHKKMCQRRKECRESWLVKTIHQLNNQILNSLVPSRKQVLLHRLVVELVEFMTEKTSEGQNLSGRTTGSIAWRLARGEAGSKLVVDRQPYTFKLTEMEKRTKSFHIQYSCSKDEYVRLSDNGSRTVGYEAMIGISKNIFRKEEHDWNMVYLARKEGTDKAEVSWKFDFEDSGLKIDIIMIRVDCKTFENGNIVWKLSSDYLSTVLKGDAHYSKDAYAKWHPLHTRSSWVFFFIINFA
ncbi:hypothetical protein CHS0354_017836 [Potamilus streckersoni]|uniref:Peptide-N(4)-(N-acetyl-beta-glucosaminyl)asparagine amidase n=1 Tax=Potamilus streckersoni TaxID=2493646 RepID=A0AAE0T6M6_9BIVA|nr:hypothetical protein CHS0354_017836 [Potamilus streckersoni]